MENSRWLAPPGPRELQRRWVFLEKDPWCDARLENAATRLEMELSSSARGCASSGDAA